MLLRKEALDLEGSSGLLKRHFFLPYPKDLLLSRSCLAKILGLKKMPSRILQAMVLGLYSHWAPYQALLIRRLPDTL